MSIERETGRSSNPLVSAIQDRIDAAMLSANTILPAKVKRFDSKTGFAEVALLTRQVFSPTDEKGTPASIPFPILTHVPVLFFGTKGVHVSAKVSEGDLGLCLFSQRSIDYFRTEMEREAKERAGLSAVGADMAMEAPVNLRRFALEDAMFLPAYFAGGKERTGEDNAIRRNKVNPLTGDPEPDLAIGEVTDPVTQQKKLAVDKGQFKLGKELTDTNRRISDNSDSVRAVAASGPATAASLPIVIKNTILAKIAEVKAYATRKQAVAGAALGVASLFAEAIASIRKNADGQIEFVREEPPPQNAPLPLFATITPAKLAVGTATGETRGFVLPGFNNVAGRDIFGDGVNGGEGEGEADLSQLSADPESPELGGAGIKAPDLRSWSNLCGLYLTRRDQGTARSPGPFETKLTMLWAAPADTTSYVNKIILCRETIRQSDLKAIAGEAEAPRAAAQKRAQVFVFEESLSDPRRGGAPAPDGGAALPFAGFQTGALTERVTGKFYLREEATDASSASPVWFLYFFDGDGEPLSISFPEI